MSHGSVRGIPKTNSFGTSGLRLSFAVGLQFALQCAMPLRLCFFYDLRVKFERGESKLRYFWRI